MHRRVAGGRETDASAADCEGTDTSAAGGQEVDPGLIGQVRSFNRTVTQRIGALSDEFLSRDRPLGQARLLWEIGPDGCDIRLLRSRLDLDSGYLSRLLRALERDGLVVVKPSRADG